VQGYVSLAFFRSLPDPGFFLFTSPWVEMATIKAIEARSVGTVEKRGLTRVNEVY
jgi:hypothetical protein